MWAFAAVRTTVVAGRVLVVGLFSNLDGDTACRVYDAGTGDLLGVLPIGDDWVYATPERQLSVMDGYATVRTRGSAYAVVRLSAAGPERVEWLTPPTGQASTVVLGRQGRRAVVLASDGDRVTTYGLPTGARLGPEWTAPSGWRIDDLVRSGRRMYAWLADGDRCWLWDAGAARPVAPPATIRGLRWGPWDLGGRPALLHLAWRRYEARDLALGASIGPPLAVAAHELGVPCLGTVHGRRVLAAATDHRVRVWDLPTGRLVHSGQCAQPPLALAVHESGLAVVDRQGRVAPVPVRLRSVHPLAAAETS